MRGNLATPDPEEPLLPDVTSDESDAGWGDEPAAAERDPDDLERFLRDVPPHHGS